MHPDPESTAPWAPAKKDKTQGTCVPIHELLHPLLIRHQGLVLVVCQRGPCLAVNAADHVAHFRPVVLQLLRLPVRLCRDLSVRQHKAGGQGQLAPPSPSPTPSRPSRPHPLPSPLHPALLSLQRAGTAPGVPLVSQSPRPRLWETSAPSHNRDREC